jgi:hypothetical protein
LIKRRIELAQNLRLFILKSSFSGIKVVSAKFAHTTLQTVGVAEVSTVANHATVRIEGISGMFQNGTNH